MTALDTTLLFLQVSEVFAEEKACEVPFHDENPRGHEGSATWYVKTHCLNCTAQSVVFAACDKYVEILKHGTMPMMCLPCGTDGAMFAITLLEKIQ